MRIVAITTVVCALLFGWSGARLSAADQPLLHLNIATIPADIGAQPYYAKEQKIFEKYGLDVTIYPFQTGGAMLAANVGGSVDIGWSNIVTLSQAYLKGVDVTIVGAANMYNANDPAAGKLVVMRDSTIRDAKDLDGKVIAVGGIGAIADNGAKAWIDRHGGDSNNVKFVEMPMASMAAAIESGHIDAGVIDANSYTTQNKPGDPLRLLGNAYDAIAPSFASSVWFSTSHWAAAHPAELKAFIAAMLETAKWANTHHAETAGILAKYTKATTQQIMDVPRVTYGERLTDSAVQPQIDLAAKYGLIKTRVSADDLINKLAR